jgi:hypothetical protein
MESEETMVASSNMILRKHDEWTGDTTGVDSSDGQSSLRTQNGGPARRWQSHAGMYFPLKKCILRSQATYFKLAYRSSPLIIWSFLNEDTYRYM